MRNQPVAPSSQLRRVVAVKTRLRWAMLFLLAIGVIAPIALQAKVSPDDNNIEQPIQDSFSPLSAGWAQQTSGTGNNLFSVHFVNANEGWAVGSSNTILHTINGGTTWTAQTNQGSVPVSSYLGVRFIDSNTGWAGGGSAVMRTTDGGASWAEQGATQDGRFRNNLFTVSSTAAWIPTQNAVSSARWFSRFTVGSGEENFNVLSGSSQYFDMYFTDADNGWAVGTGPIVRITSASSASPSFSFQTTCPCPTLNGIHMLDANTGWAVGNGGVILKTTNGGSNWNSQTSNTTTNLRSVHFADASRGWAVGIGGLILMSTDGGVTWAQETSGVSTDLRRVFFVDANTGYAVGLGGTILKRSVVSTPGTLQFLAANTNNAETNAGTHTVDIAVTRTGGSDGAASVDYTVADGAATTADNDYSISPASGTLNWADGDAANKNITITVNGDTAYEADETVNLTLSNPTGGATIGSPNPATLTITNDDAAPTLGNYADTSIALAGNTMVTPDAGMTNNTSATAETTHDFKGKLEVNPTTGVVRVTNAHPAGIYTVNVYASNGGSTTKQFLLTVTTPAGCQPFFSNGFVPAMNLAGNGGPYSLAVGDINGDGKQDFVSANNGSTASVWLRKSDNTGFETRLDYSVGAAAQSVALGDLNGDGKQDIVTGNYIDNTVSVLLRNASNTGFDPKVDYPVNTRPVFVAVGDLNGDGRLDIVAVNTNANNISIFLRKSDNSGFDPKIDYAVGAQPNSVAIADFNADGKPDLAVTNIGSDTVSVFMRNASNTDFDPRVDIAAGHTPFKVAAGDYDGDGKQDMAITDADANRITVLYRNAANTGFDSTNFGAGTGPTGIASGDFNNDAKQDLTVTNFYDNNTYVYLRNAGNTGFDSPISFATALDSISVAVGDFNGDNRQDLVVANPPANNVSLLMRQCFEAPTFGSYGNASVDLSGNTTVTPGAAIANADYATANSSADFKGRLEVNPSTGVVLVTNAHPAGTYTVNLKAFGPGGTATASFMLTVTTPAGCGTFLGSGFFPATNLAGNGGPYSLAVGDINGDGKQDFVAANNGNIASVWLRKSDNTGFETRLDYSVGSADQSIALGDLNGDGKEDIVTGNYIDNTVSVLLRNAANTGFDTKVDYPVNARPVFVAIGDLNGDGRLDIVAVNTNDNNISALLRKSDNSGFDAKIDYAVGAQPNSVAIADFNGDAKPDLAVTNIGSDTVSVFLRNASNTNFDPKVDIAAGHTPFKVAAGDYNGDGKQDMAITDADSNNITVLYRNAANTGFDSTNFGAGTGPTGIASGDFNNDGKQDLAVTNFYSNNTYVYLRNAGNTGFDSPISFATDIDSISVAVGDFNGDNRQDLIVANPPAHNVSLLMRDCSAAGWISFAGAPYTTSETNADHDVTITVRRMFGSNGAVDVNYSISDGTATTGDNDYSVSSESGTLHWNNGDSTDKTRTINVKGDTKRETDETVNLQLSGVTGGATLISPNPTTLTITNDDPLPTITIDDVTHDEGNTGTTAFIFAVTLSNPSSTTITVDFATQNNSATQPSDYTLNTGTLNFVPGDTQKTITVLVNGDATYEPNETFFVNLTNNSSNSILPANTKGTGTITNDDPNPVTLGNYPNTSVQLSGNTTVTPDASPANATRINVSTSTNFKGRLEGDATTGVVRVTDAHPAGVYTVTVRAFDSGGISATKTFSLTVTTPATCNPVSFAAGATFGVGFGAISVAVGDFNGDGKQDLAVANYNSNNVSILLGDGAGSFSAATTFAVGTGPVSVAVGDFNGNGKQDLAVANADSSNVSILSGDGTGSFSAATNFVVGDRPFSVTVGDFNGDGKQDLAAANQNSDNMSILLGDGAGSFSAATNFGVGDRPFSVAVGDFNGDGKQDVVVANAGSSNVSILLGDGTGSFSGATNFDVGAGPASVAVGDFNGDGKQDLSVANNGSNNVSILLGDGVGSFSAATNFGVGSQPLSVAVGDFNGDGKQDLSVANQFSDNVSILLGDGAGSFSAATNFRVGNNVGLVAVGDFNADGKQDLAVAIQNFTSVWVLLRQCQPTLSINSTSTQTEGDSGQANVTFTVTLSSTSSQVVTVNYLTANGSLNPATGGATCGGMVDFVTTSGTLTFNPGETTKTIDVPICGDTRDEPDETFTVTLDTPSNAGIAAGTSTATITDNDPMPTITIDNVTQNEGDSSTTAFTFTVTLSNPPQGAITVDFATQNDTATQPSDYTLNTGTVNFVPGDTQETITVLVNGDTAFEPNETFFVNLTNNSSNSILAPNTKGTGTITNDDSAPSFSIDDVTHNEGNSGTTSYTFTVTKTGSTALNSSVNFTAVDGSATTADNDYQAQSGSLTFLPADTTKQITVLVNGDTTFESDEDFSVHLSSASNAIIGDADGTGTITNDDSAPSFAIDDVTHNEGNSGTTSYTFTVTKTGSTALNSSVNFTTVDGSATTADNDYQAQSGSLTFLPADTTKQITVLVNGDTKFESDEVCTVHLSNASGATITDADGTGTITNDDSAPTLSIDDVTHSEGNAGTTSFTFTVTKSGSTALNAVVNYNTVNGTATTANNDYQAQSGSLTFLPADTTKTITILVNGDTNVEPDEAFTVHLSGATGATISDADGTGTITNDDVAAPALGNYPNKVVQAGGNTTVTPDAAPTSTTSVNVSATSPFRGALTASPTTGVVTVTNAQPAGAYTVTVTAFNSAGITTTKTFTLTVTNPMHCDFLSFSGASGSPYAVGSYPTSVAVGDFNGDGKQDITTANGDGASNNVTVLLGDGSGGFSFASGSPFAVGNYPYSMSVGDFNGDGKLDIVTANLDTSNVTLLLGDGSGAFTPAAGSPFGVGARPFFVATGDFNGDGKLDLATANLDASSLTVLLGDGGGGFTSAPGSPFVIGLSPYALATGDFNGDAKVDLAAANRDANNVTVLLGDGAGGFTASTGSPFAVGTSPWSVSVGDFNGDRKQDLAAANQASTNVTVILGDGTGGFSAASGSPFAVGSSPQSVAASDFNGDGKLDLITANYSTNRNVTLLLGNGSGGFSAAIGSPFAVGLAPWSVAVGDFNADGRLDLATPHAGDSNSVSVMLNTCTSNEAPTISAVAATRQEGSASANATIANVSDTEDPETALTVTVNGGASATVNGVMLSGISVNSAGVVTADVIADCTATTATFTLRVTDTGSLFNEATLTVTVDANTSPTLTYASPQTVVFGGSLNVSPTATGDNGTVTYSVQPGHGLTTAPTADSNGIVSITNAQPAGAHTVTIRATDNCGSFTEGAFTLNVGDLPAFTIDDVTHNEGNAGTTSFTFTVTKTGSTGLNSTVNFTTVDGSATTASNDYQALSGSLTFLPADTTKQITMLVNGDTTFESDETFTVHLSSPTNATIADADGAGTITNDDTAPAFTIDDVTHNEGNAGTTSYTFTVTKTGSTALNSSVNFTTVDGTATTADGDYQAQSGTLTFLPSDTTKQVTVMVNGDTKFESDETFTLHLSNPSGATIVDADGTGTITNDDGAPTFAIDDVTHNEGNTGTTSYTFTVTKTGATALNSSVNFTTADGTAKTSDNDYQTVSGTLSFLPADTTRTITVLVTGDTTLEADEAFTVHLSGAAGATISDADSTGTITNDDCSFSLSSNSQNFGAAGGMDSVNVITGTGCAWTAASNDAFITVTSGSSGSGGGTVNYTVASNVGPSRMGTMTIAGITFTVTQDSGCMFTLSRDHQSFAGNGGPGSVDVIASDSACQWTASTAATFIQITSGTPGTGNGTLQYTVDANPGPAIRSATITIGGQTFTVYQGIDFLDVPQSNPFYNEIGKLSARGVTLGCGSGNYCPDDQVLRDQMAAFIMRAKGEFNPPTPAMQRFVDVPPENVFYKFIDRLAELQITLGCSPTMYCPSDAVKREQMAAFIIRGLGEFNPPLPGSQRFTDVPPENPFYKFIDRMAVLQITLGCSPTTYCPNDIVTRASMAAFLVRAFNL